MGVSAFHPPLKGGELQAVTPWRRFRTFARVTGRVEQADGGVGAGLRPAPTGFSSLASNPLGIA